MSQIPAPTREPVDIGIITVIPPELDAVRLALELPESARIKEGPSDTVYWRGTVHSALRRCNYSLVLAAIGWAGTSNAAALATQMIERYRPRVVLLVGIAAGMRGKVQIGDVVLSERVVAYESAAWALDENNQPVVQLRPEITRIAHGIQQDVMNYKYDSARLLETFRYLGGGFPRALWGKKKEWKTHVASSVVVRPQVTFASGDKLLKDPSKLRELRSNVHGKIEAGEMEAAGLVSACHVTNTPWLMIRGISDFGDDFKNDEFHWLASKTAATVMVDFLRHGLDLGKPYEEQPRSDGRPFIVGLPIVDDADFFGRTIECETILLELDRRHPVQILGGALSGKSSVLHWVERHASSGRPVVWIQGAGHSPVMLVAEIAKKLERPDVAAELERKGANLELAKQKLGALSPFVLLIDDADSMATAKGHSEDFFQYVRGLIEKRQLSWVSASRRDLYWVFKDRGLASRFLNSSRRTFLGPLDRVEAARLAARAGAHAAWLLDEAGGFAHGLQWLGERLSKNAEDLDSIRDAFRREMRDGPFASWWEALRPELRPILQQCARGPVVDNGDEACRWRLNELRDAGHLVKVGLEYRLPPGAAWQEFLRAK